MPLRPTVVRLRYLLPLLLVAACAPEGPDALAPEQVDVVVVEQDLGDGSPPTRWTLVCAGQVEGDHPEAEAACAHLAGLDEPFAPLPADQVCTEQYGGPETARITGTWGGEPVDLVVTRTNGCEISQWEGLRPLLSEPVGVAPPEDAPQ